MEGSGRRQRARLPTRSPRVAVAIAMFPRRNRLAIALAATAVFAWALWLRADGISRDFWLMQDQIGDWQTVQGDFLSLPLTGPAKTGGGTHLGPVYYWWLWLARQALSPWTGRLPHAMGIAGGILDAAAFALLVPAIASAGVPPLASVAAVLLAATVPYEAALARAGWNPCFALACLVLALALLLLGRHRPTATLAALVAALAWAAVGSHLAAIVVALPLLLGIVAAAARSGSGAAAKATATVALVVVAMQFPWLLAQRGYGTRVWRPGAPAAEPGRPGTPVSGITAAGPADGPTARPAPDGDPGDATTAVTRTMDAIGADPARLFSGRGLSFVAVEAPALLLRSLWLPRAVSTGLLAVAALLVAFGVARGRVAPLPAVLAILPLGFAAVAYAAFTGELPTYFAIPLLAPLALLSALAVAALPPRAATIAGGTLLAATLLGQPHRLEDRRWEHSWRWYATAVRGARAVAAGGVAVGAVEGPVGDGTAASALAVWLGARIDPDVATVARISRDGRVDWIDRVDRRGRGPD